MDEYPRVEMKNFTVVKCIFRRLGWLYNEGRIVVDLDSYNFVGHLTNDVIIAKYNKGAFEIKYYQTTYECVEILGQMFLADKRHEMIVPFKKGDPNLDFSDNVLRYIYIGEDESSEYEVEFVDYETDPDIINETIYSVQDLIV